MQQPSDLLELRLEVLGELPRVGYLLDFGLSLESLLDEIWLFDQR